MIAAGLYPHGNVLGSCKPDISHILLHAYQHIPLRYLHRQSGHVT
jgi:hypothetical protein